MGVRKLMGTVVVTVINLFIRAGGSYIFLWQF